MTHIVNIDRANKMITLDRRPQSKREVMSLLLAYWRDMECDYHIGEVMDFPNKIYFKVHWDEEQKEMEGNK